MRILLATTDLYSTTGGGQSFYTNVIRRHPEHDFWYFGTRDVSTMALPPNVTVLPVPDHYRANRGPLSFDREDLRIDGYSLSGLEGEVLQFLDMAVACAGHEFDIVEIPDFLAYGAILPAAMRYLGIRFDRVVCSMHGTISNVLTDNWNFGQAPDLTLCRKFEDLLYRIADIRIGISPDYIDQWQAKCGSRAALVDLFQLMDFSKFADLRSRQSSNTSNSMPDLVFVGRQDRCKGPDLFVELVSSVPKRDYRDILMIGPPVELGGINSWAELTTMASRRGLRIVNQNMSQSDLWSAYARNSWVTIFPSRIDTLNLAALESLLCGAPAAISTAAGVCRFLDEVFPGIPFLRQAPSELGQARRDLAKYVGEYRDQRQRLLTYLETAQPRPIGSSLTAAYESTPTPDLDRKSALDSLVVKIGQHFDAHIRSTIRTRVRAHVATQIGSMFEQNGLTNCFMDVFDHASSHQDIRRDVARLSQGDGGLPDYEYSVLANRLGPSCFSGDRVPTYKLLAMVERQRGNDLLYATYQLRAMRLSGASDPAILSEVCSVLQANKFEKEADAARILYGTTLDYRAALNYLSDAAAGFREPPKESFSARIDRRMVDNPKISVVVSLYNAADKIRSFLLNLSQQTEIALRRTEVILVDSNSQDRTQSIVEECQAEFGATLSILYVRTPNRETIQHAWNRGIALARGDYLALLGVDEMNRPDALEVMGQYLDRHAGVDWVQGSAVVTDVNAAGAYLRDVMAYDRSFRTQYVQLLDTCYLGYVGALYRKNVHGRAGFYDHTFRAAGDTEFKNRALRHMRVVTLPECLGYFRNYPDERTTQSPTAELEDLRAWYLHRTHPGMEVIFGNGNEHAAGELFQTCLGYRKSYMQQECTDVELAVALADFFMGKSTTVPRKVQSVARAIRSSRDCYQLIDRVSELSHREEGAAGAASIGGILESLAFNLKMAREELKVGGRTVDLSFTNDNRSHQHHTIWPSRNSHQAKNQLPSIATQSSLTNERAKRRARRRRLGNLLGFNVALTRQVQKHISEGDNARDSGNWVAAGLSYRHAVSLEPDLPHIWVQLGHSLKEQGDRTGGEAAYRKAIDLDDQNADSYLQLGHVLKLQHRLTEAAHSYYWAYNLDHSLKDAQRELIALGFSRNEIEEALVNGILPAKVLRV